MSANTAELARSRFGCRKNWITLIKSEAQLAANFKLIDFRGYYHTLRLSWKLRPSKQDGGREDRDFGHGSIWLK
jgi:hypothetical protein